MVDFSDRVLPRTVVVRPWRPMATYGLLAVMAGVWIAEVLLYQAHLDDLLVRVFVIRTDWLSRPWTLVTSTLAHDYLGLSHLLFNGIFLASMGPSVERLVGRKRFLALFLTGGALAGVLQVHLANLIHPGDAGALGASGALMVILGLLIALLPHQKMLLYFILPVPMWAAGALFAVLDLLGVLDPYADIGHFAHLAGLALGLGAGFYFKADLRRRGLRIVSR